LVATPSVASPADEPAQAHPMVTRYGHHMRKEKAYTDDTVRYDSRRRAFFAAPVSHHDALRDPEWYAAMSAKFDALSQTKTWILVPQPPGVNIVGSKWILKLSIVSTVQSTSIRPAWLLVVLLSSMGLIMQILSVQL
jgi:hypothetical protein